MLDTGGNVTGRQAHLPFGEDFAESGTQEKHHFTSYERDSESGLDYAINRQYSPATGRFTRTDPSGGSYRLEAPQSLNRFSYVQNSPVDLTDPTGLDFGTGWWRYPGWMLCIIFPGYCETPLPGGESRDPEGRSGGGVWVPRPPPSTRKPRGHLTVDENCGHSVLYVPEDNAWGSDHPEKAWKDAARANNVEADFVATARGIVKISACECKVSCSNGDDYKITCTCGITGLITAPRVLTDDDFASGVVADPRDVPAWREWVGTRNHYVRIQRSQFRWVFN